MMVEIEEKLITLFGLFKFRSNKDKPEIAKVYFAF